MTGFDMKPLTREENARFWRMTVVAAACALVLLALAVVQWANNERMQGEHEQQWTEGVGQ